MDSSKLERLLIAAKKNIESDKNLEVTEFVLSCGETIEVKQLTREEKRAWQGAFPAKQGTAVKDVVLTDDTKKVIYKACGLNKVAEQAKKDGLIANYYDIVDVLMDFEDMVGIFAILQNGPTFNEDEYLEKLGK